MKHFGATMYSVSHCAKFYTHHWYTASRAYKFGQVDSAECKCCRDGVQETTAHIIQCPDRNEVHLERHQKVTKLLADQQLLNVETCIRIRILIIQIAVTWCQ